MGLWREIRVLEIVLELPVVIANHPSPEMMTEQFSLTARVVSGRINPSSGLGMKPHQMAWGATYPTGGTSLFLCPVHIKLRCTYFLEFLIVLYFLRKLNS